MYKHILVPTDGSKLARKGVKAGMRLARALGARVTGVYVVPPYQPPMYGEAAIYLPGLSASAVQAQRHARRAPRFRRGHRRGARRRAYPS